MVKGPAGFVKAPDERRVRPGRAIHQRIDDGGDILRTHLYIGAGGWLTVDGAAGMLVASTQVSAFDHSHCGQCPILHVSEVLRYRNDLAQMIVRERLEAEDARSRLTTGILVSVIDLPRDARGFQFGEDDGDVKSLR